MSQRFYPRNEQARTDAILGNIYHGPREDRSRRDGLAYGMGNTQAAVAGTGTAADCTESEIVSGGETVIFTITGNDRFRPVAEIAAAVIAGLPTAGGIKAALAADDFALDDDRKVLTCTLPAVAGYSISEDEDYDWTLPVSAFENRAESVTITAAIGVTNEA